MWSSLIFILVVAAGAFLAWKCYKRSCRWDDADEYEANAITPPPPPAPRMPRVQAHAGAYRRQVQAVTAPQAPATRSDDSNDFLTGVLVYELMHHETETKPTYEGGGGSFGGGGASGSWDSSPSDSGSSSSDSSSSSSSDY